MNRLNQLTESALFYKSPVYNRRLLFEYRLTPKGIDLYPVILSIWRFHRHWDLDPSVLPENLVHTVCGQPFMPVLVCSTCKEEPTSDTVAVQHRGVDPAAGESVAVRRTRIANELESMGDTFLATVVLGDAWNVLLLNAASRGVSRFHDLQKQLGISSNILAARLRLMVQLDLLAPEADETDKRVRNYELTDKGRETYPIILTLIAWGDRWLTGSEGPSEILVHDPCNSYLSLRLQCSACSEGLHVGNVIPASLHS